MDNADLHGDVERLALWGAELRTAVDIGDDTNAAYLALAIVAVANRVNVYYSTKD